MTGENEAWVAIGERLRNAREYLSLTQEEAAQAVSIPRSALSLIENGRRKVDAVELARFAKVYGQSIDALSGSAPAEIPDDVRHLARASKDLSEEDRAELLSFAAYLQARAAKKDGERG
jgi:transcriptional regulator with XRE-family HTH domain